MGLELLHANEKTSAGRRADIVRQYPLAELDWEGLKMNVRTVYRQRKAPGL